MFRSLTLFLIATFSIAVVAGQAPDLNKGMSKETTSTEKLRDLPFTNGVNLPFVIRELARDIDLNVLFDPESRLEMRTTRIDLRNVTINEAINAIMLQERLVFEQAGPKTILVSSSLRGNSLPQIGVGLTLMTGQLKDYFGVQSGILINNVNADSPAASAGLKAGDVIVELDGTPGMGPLALYRAINEKNGTEILMKIVRDRRSKVVTVNLEKASNSAPAQRK